MEKLFLERDTTSEKGTFGTLVRSGKIIAQTCELPWHDNQDFISCIPKGVYMVGRYFSPSKGSVFLLKNVPDRDMIEIHMGNTIFDIKGCILPGAARGMLVPKGHDTAYPAVLDSSKTMLRLLRELPGSFYLQVMGVCG